LRYGLQTRPTKGVDLRIPPGPIEAREHLRRAIAAAVVDDNFSDELGEVAPETRWSSPRSM
jgi:hypothetical protein